MKIEKDRKYWMLLASIILLSVGIMVSIGWAGSLWYELQEMKKKEQQRQEEVTRAQEQNQPIRNVGETSR